MSGAQCFCIGGLSLALFLSLSLFSRIPNIWLYRYVTEIKCARNAAALAFKISKNARFYIQGDSSQLWVILREIRTRPISKIDKAIKALRRSENTLSSFCVNSLKSLLIKSLSYNRLRVYRVVNDILTTRCACVIHVAFSRYFSRWVLSSSFIKMSDAYFTIANICSRWKNNGGNIKNASYS